MFKIDTTTYERLAEELASQITSDSVFAGKVAIETDDADITLTITMIPYFTQVDYPEGRVDVLENIVPVGWELRTITLDGDVINDFDFQTFKELLCQW